MLLNVGMGKEFWAEACNTTVYLINRAPSFQLNFAILEEEWTGKQISYSHLRVFGCEAFALVPKEKKTKLDHKSKCCIFVGYGKDEYGFWLWELVAKKIIRSRDVVFNEKSFPVFQVQNQPVTKYVPLSLFENSRSPGVS